MDNFKAIYKILKCLDRNMGNENFDQNMISAEALKIPEARWEQILIELQRNGYIDGVPYNMTMNDHFPHIGPPITPRIT